MFVADLDHSHLKPVVRWKAREKIGADGHADIARAVRAEPAKSALDLKAANLKVPVGVIGSATNLRRELHDLDVGSKAGQHVCDLRNVGGEVQKRHKPD